MLLIPPASTSEPVTEVFSQAWRLVHQALSAEVSTGITCGKKAFLPPTSSSFPFLYKLNTYISFNKRFPWQLNLLAIFCLRQCSVAWEPLFFSLLFHYFACVVDIFLLQYPLRPLGVTCSAHHPFLCHRDFLCSPENVLAIVIPTLKGVHIIAMDAHSFGLGVP